MIYDVITLGTATRDVFLESDSFRVLKDPAHLKKIGFPTGEAQCFGLGAKVEVRKPVFTIGGGAANSAVTFARQNLRTAAIVKVGDDAHGSSILEALRSEDVSVFPLRDKKEGTAYSVILLSPTGERTILTYRGASNDIGKSEIPFSKLSARWLYVVPGGIPLDTIRAAIVYAKKAGMRIAMNPSRAYIERGAKKLMPFLNALDAVFLNREEAVYLTGSDYNAEHAIFRKLDRMVSGIAVMTDGPHGVVVSDGAHLYRAGVYKEKRITDRTGAGDAFASGFVAALAATTRMNAEKGKVISSDVIQRAVRLGSANATSVVEYIGAQEGVLTKYAFEHENRWKNLSVRISSLTSNT